MHCTLIEWLPVDVIHFIYQWYLRGAEGGPGRQFNDCLTTMGIKPVSVRKESVNKFHKKIVKGFYRRLVQEFLVFL